MEFIDIIGSMGPRLLEWTGSATASQWSLLVLAFLCWGDGFFPPLPAGTLVSALGAASISSGSPLLLVGTIAVASTFALAGDMTMVSIGRTIPRDGESRFSRLAHTIGSHAEEHWTVLLSTSRFIPVLRVAVFLAAGSQRIPRRRILLLDGIAATTWGCVYALAGGLGGSLASHPMVGMLIGILIGGLAGTLVGLVAQRLQLSRANLVTDVPPTPSSPSTCS
jgi:Uncharacterized membrane-associated protein